MHDALFYDQTAGLGQFHHFDYAPPSRPPFRSYPRWRKTWDKIVPGEFSDNGHSATDLLFYDAPAGVGVFYSTDGRGEIHKMSETDSWRHTWDQIVPGFWPLRSGQSSGVLFYDASAGEMALYNSVGFGGCTN